MAAPLLVAPLSVSYGAEAHADEHDQPQLSPLKSPVVTKGPALKDIEVINLEQLLGFMQAAEAPVSADPEGVPAESASLDNKAAGDSPADAAPEEPQAVLKPILLDVAGTKSYEAGHIPGALDIQAANKKLPELLEEVDRQTPVVVYCSDHECPAYRYGVIALRKLGFTNIKYFQGGLQAWKKADKPLERAAEPASND